MKYLLLLIVLVLVWRHWLKRSAASRKSVPPASKPSEKMLTCATCHVHMPESEAILDRGRAYCCEAHRAAATERRP